MFPSLFLPILYKNLWGAHCLIYRHNSFADGHLTFEYRYFNSKSWRKIEQIRIKISFFRHRKCIENLLNFTLIWESKLTNVA